MVSKSRNNIITFIGAALVSLLFFILSLLDKELILNPYTVSIGIAIILSMFIYYAIKSSQDLRSEILDQNKTIENFENKILSFEEKFKIHDRLNKLEVKVNG